MRINTIEAGPGNSAQPPTMNGPVSPTIPQVIHISDPKTAHFPKKVQECLNHTNEDLQSVVNSQWIIDKAISNDIDFSTNTKLSVINRIIPHRDTLLTSIAAFTKHSETMEGRRFWDTELSKTAKGVARSAEKFHDFRTEFSTIVTDPNIEQNMKEPIKHLSTE